MTKVKVHTNIVLGLACTILFVSFFPILDIFFYPVSVLHGTDYEPLILRLPRMFWETGLTHSSLIAVPSLLLALTLLMQGHGFSLVRSIPVFLAPFSLALIIHYFIAVQLDTDLRSARMGHPI